MSKGSKQRPTDMDKYREAYERIFGKDRQRSSDRPPKARDGAPQGAKS